MFEGDIKKHDGEGKGRKKMMTNIGFGVLMDKFDSY